MQFLRQNTAVIITVGPFYDKTDGVTIEGSLTITNERITMTADTDAGSAPTNILDNVTGATSGTDNDLNYITGNDAGMMQLELSAANTNRVGRMLLSITDAANHVPVFMELFVLPAAIFDWLTGVIVPLPANVTTWLGTAAATPTVAGVPEVDVTHWLGTAAATPTVAGVPEVDLTHLGGVAQSATDLKDFADDGYDPATNKVQGVVLTDTLTTYTGNTVQTGDSFARIGATGSGLTSLSTQASVDDLPTNAELATALAAADDAVLAAIAALNNLSQANVRTAVGLASANLDTQLDALPTAIENADALLKRDIDLVEATAALHSLTSAILKAVSKVIDNGAGALETYRTDGTTLHMSQAIGTDAALDPIESLGVGA